MRRAYLLSVILFIANSERFHPFHVLLADTVESCGGSTELITLLNRLGAVSSVDTLKRHIQTVSQVQKDEGVEKLLVKDAVTVASTDNIDFLQSHAAVYSGSQHRSWHATSIQLVQPRPSTCKPMSNEESNTNLLVLDHSTARRKLFISSTSEESTSISRSSDFIVRSGPSESTCNFSTDSDLVCARPHPIATVSEPSFNAYSALHESLSRKRQERCSPFSSPQRLTRSPCAKKQRRARTFSEARTLLGQPLSESGAETLHRRPGRVTCRPDLSHLEFNDFCITGSEKEAYNQLADITFDYMLQREASDPANILVDLKTYYGLLAPNIPSAERSNVVYLSVIDKHADTTEAMEAVVSKLHKEYGVGIRADNLVVVGDQKTYTRLFLYCSQPNTQTTAEIKASSMDLIRILAPNPQPLPSFGRRVKVLFDGKKRYPGVIIAERISARL